MYYSIYDINLAQFFQKVNIPKVISGHMCLIRYQNTCVLIRHFSVAKIPITHCILYNKKVYHTSISHIARSSADVKILRECRSAKYYPSIGLCER